MYSFGYRTCLSLRVLERVRCTAVRVGERGRRLDPLYVGDHLPERRVQQPLPVRVRPEDRRLRPAGNATATAARPAEPANARRLALFHFMLLLACCTAVVDGRLTNAQ